MSVTHERRELLTRGGGGRSPSFIYSHYSVIHISKLCADVK